MHTMMKRMSTGDGENLSSSSTSLVLNNIDLLIQILLCLPVETLLVLKPVSKHWYALISGPYFMKQHHLLHYNKLSASALYFRCQTPNNEQSIARYDLFLLDKAKTTTNVSFVIQVNEKPVGLCIYQSCNGLLLCYGPSGIHCVNRYIYNPSTRHCRTIPPPPFPKEIDFYPYFSLFFLAYSPHISLNYEIVFFWRTGDDIAHYKHQMAVYSSETGSWRLCGYVEFDSRLYNYLCVFWNGCLNWIVNIAGLPTLFYFNVAQQVLQRKSWLRVDMDNEPEEEYFGECTGHMYIILRDKASKSYLRDKASKSYFLSVFEMETDYSGWKPICRVDLGGLANQYGNDGVSVRCPLSYSILKVLVEGDGDEDELKVLILVPHKVVSYDLKTNSFKEICDYQMGRYYLQPSFFF